MVLRVLRGLVSLGRVISGRAMGTAGANGALRSGLTVTGSGLERVAAGTGDGATACRPGPGSVTTSREDVLLGEERGDSTRGGLSEDALPESGTTPGREVILDCAARG